MTAGLVFLSSIGPDIASYLTFMRALGRKYDSVESILTRLDHFLADTGPDADLTSETFTGWCAFHGHLAPGVRRNRMLVIRQLCVYRRRSVPTCFVPDPLTFPKAHERVRPYLFTDQEIVNLLKATGELTPAPNSPLRREVYRMAIVLLHTTGLRRGELARLNIDDYDPAEHALMIRATKFFKSRLIPLSIDATREIESFLVARRQLPHSPQSPLLCNLGRGLRAYTGAGLAQGLRQLFLAANVRTSSGKLPRTHDMRHSFAHHALLRWYREGADVQAKLPALAAYMGHASVVSTQYYLSLLEPIVEMASQLFERHCATFLGDDAAGDAR